MKQLLSVWLIPQENDEKILREIINNLAKENNSPQFIPHLTLFGDITIEPEKLINAVDKVFKNVEPFKIIKTQISYSEEFFKTVFVEFKKSEVLKTLFTNLSKETGKKDINLFKPHISLIYKIMEKDKKLQIINKLSIPENLIINRVFINTPKPGENDFFDVDGWQSLYVKKLDY